MKIIIITPTRDEGVYIGETLESMTRQTVRPHRWVIVDDGSSDDTREIVRRYCEGNPFIRYISTEDRGYRAPATGVINAFYNGYDTIRNEDYDIIAKFDADLKFPPDTLEKIIRAFEENTQLGITGGLRYDYDPRQDTFFKVVVPPKVVGGPTKFYRKQCFEDIGGLINRAGWDGVDTVRANMMGWDSYELDSVKILHLKPTGSADGGGLKRANLKYGDVSYYMGGHLWYFALRVVGRSYEGRSITSGVYMVKGYLDSLLRNAPREGPVFRTFLKKQQRDNMKFWLKTHLKF